MEAILLKQPQEISFSGNPISYTLALTPYGEVERGQDIRLQVRVLVEQAAGSGAFSEVKSQTFYPDSNGLCQLNIAGVIDPYLEYYTPRPNQTRPVQAIQQRKRFKLTWLLQRANAPVGAVQESAVATAVKGGMSYESWHPNFFTRRLVEGKKALRFDAREKVGLDEIRFLYWLYPYDDNATQTVKFSITTEDGAVVEVVQPQTIFCAKWGVCCAAVGFNQLSLQSFLPAGKLPVKYSVKVMAGSVEIVAPVPFEIDHRAFYQTHQLLYRNSAGGLETVRLRGQVDMAADYELQQARRAVAPASLANLNVPAQIAQSSEETRKHTGDTGFISQEAADKLRDLFLSEERYELVNGRLLPIVLNNKAVKFFSNRDNLIAVQVDWQAAYTNDYYTPEGLVPAYRTCPGMETFVVKQAGKSAVQIMWALAHPYDRVEVQLLVGANVLSYRYSGNTGVVKQSFAKPEGVASITVKGRTLCDEDSGDAGAWSTVELPLQVNSLLVATDDVWEIGPGFTAAQALPGSVLDNDYDPDGDVLEVVLASGATSKGGQYSIAADGKVTYTPPSAAFSGADSFDYEVRELGGTTTATARVTINVGQALGVFVKMVGRNLYNEASMYTSYASGEEWVDFFSDPAGTQPLDLTGRGIILNVEETYRSQDFSGQRGDYTSVAEILAAGTRLKVYEGDPYQSNMDPYLEYEYFSHRTYRLLAGNGYTVI